MQEINSVASLPRNYCVRFDAPVDDPAMAFVAPAHSKTRVNKAGNSVRAGIQTEEDLDVVNGWRAAHAYILNTFQATLRTRSRGKKIVVAQRHKRLWTIFNKLKRQPGMQLARMHDIAGCRLIFDTIEDLQDFRTAFHRARFNHRIRNDKDAYNYLLTPKEDGYRGIHDVYEYNSKRQVGKRWNGLLLELQYRTAYQHAWATSVEIVGLVTENQPKFDAGDERYLEFFRLASEIIARAYENSTSCYPTMSSDEVIDWLNIIDSQIALRRTLEGLNASNMEVLSGKDALLIFNPDGRLDIRTFDTPEEAMESYFSLEKNSGGRDIVLVKSDSGEHIRYAFRNYFFDTRDFIHFLDEGCDILAG